MPRYLISFDDGTMIIPPEELPEVSRAAHEVVQQAKDAGVWIFGAGIDGQDVSVVGTDGSVTENPYPASKPHIGGFSIIEVASHEEALRWAAKIAIACRCSQDVRPLFYDPES
jgi:hypothetical protein